MLPSRGCKELDRTERLNNDNGPGHYSIKEAVHKLLAWGWGRGWGWRYDASVQNCEFLSRSGEACKSRGGVFSEFPLGSLPVSCFLTLEGLPAARHGDPVPPPPGHRVSSPPLLPTSLPSRAPPSQGAEGNRPALGGSTLVSKRRGSGGCHDCPVSRPRESSPEEQARAEVRFLQWVGLQVPRRHCAGAGVERRCAALAAVRLPLLLEETAGMLETSPPSGSVGRALRPTGFWGWSTHSPPSLRLPGMRNLPGHPRVTSSALLSGLWEK